MTGQWWTVKQAAEALGQSEKTIRRRIKKGEIIAEQVSGKYGAEYRIIDLKTTPTLDRDIATSNDALVKALDMIRDLQAENEKLAAHIGFLQAQLQEMQDKIRLLTAPKLPWWRHLLWWRRSRSST